MSTSSRKTLIFHIGDHKTGSTSIQLAFAQRQVTLKEGEVFYPAQVANNSLGLHCRNYGAPRSKQAKTKAANAIRHISQKIRKSDAAYNLISAESLENVPAPVFRDIVDTFFADTADDIRIVAYVRPHAGRISSAFVERTKIGAQRVIQGDLQSFFERSREAREFYYQPRFSAWRTAFGENFLLRPMIRSELFQGSVVNDFIHHAFQTKDVTLAGSGQANESLDLVDLMRLKVLQEHVQDHANPGVRLHLGWEFARLVGHLPAPETRSKLRLHKALAEQIRDTYLDDARAMDESFFNSQPFLERDLYDVVGNAPPEPQSTNPADHLSASEMRSLQISSRLISEMLQTKETKWPEFFHQKRVQDIRKIRDAVEPNQ